MARPTSDDISIASKRPKLEESETVPIFDPFIIVEEEIKSNFDYLIQRLNAKREILLEELNDIKMKYHKKEKLRLEHITSLTKLREKLEGQESKMETLNEHRTNVEAKLRQYQIPTPVPLLDITWKINELIDHFEKLLIFRDVTNIYKAMVTPSTTTLGKQLTKPSGLRIRDKDTLYIADCWDGRIQIVNIVDQQVIGEVGKGTLVWPHSVDVYDQVLYTSDYGLNAVLKFKNDEFILSSKGGELNSPFGIIVDENEVFVADNGNNRIAVLSLDLEFVREFGKMLKTPQDVNINQNRVFVANNSDAQNVHIFSKTGDLLNSIISLGNNTKSIFLCFDKFNNILISNGSSNRIHIYTIEGQLIHSIHTAYPNQYKPAGIQITHNNNILNSNGAQNTISRYC